MKKLVALIFLTFLFSCYMRCDCIPAGTGCGRGCSCVCDGVNGVKMVDGGTDDITPPPAEKPIP